MRSMVPRLEKPRASARRAHSAAATRPTLGIVAGRPMPTSIAQSSCACDMEPNTGSPHDRVGDDLIPAEEEDARIGLEAVARVAPQRRGADLEDAAAVVADEEDRAAALTCVVAGHPRAGEQHAEVVAVRVHGPARAATRRARARGVGAAADGAVAG